MSVPPTLAFLGNYAPRCCGIATFTQDLRAAVSEVRPNWQAPVAMVSDDPERYSYPQEVRWILAEKQRPDYRRLARRLNDSGAQGISLQHEYGIYGGPCGGWLLDLLDDLRMPVVTTCHTVLKEPDDMQKQVLRHIAERSARMVVMAEKGREFLRDIYGVPDSKIAVIPHGIPDMQVSPLICADVRRHHGWTGRKVILTFGLLSPNKGIENAIRALPEIVRSHPDVLYVIVGATHPNLVRENGDVYRAKLEALVRELGLENNVQFINRFLMRDELVACIAASDIYTTPYLNEAQITSGTLAYAFGLGKPVISTPYWYAAELLDNDAGVLVPFGDGSALARAACDLLADEGRRTELSLRAREKGRAMAWPEVGRSYVRIFEELASRPQRRPSAPNASLCRSSGLPPLVLNHLHRLSGPFGIHQHARFSKPDPVHGFCTDDNARAMVLLTDVMRFERLPKEGAELLKTCVSSVAAAFNEHNGRFRNFMDSEGRWLEEQGSEDSHGRALWALGHLLPHVSHGSEQWCELFLKGLHTTRVFTSPRAWAFTLLGLAAFRTLLPHDPVAQRLQEELAGRLLRLFRGQAGPRWQWFEEVVTYDNAKLPQALLVTARQLCRNDMRIVALNSLEFLLQAQRAPEGWFRAVGCKGFWKRGSAQPAQFDQQPLEAQAMVAACIEAEHSTGDRQWLERAQSIYEWFHGANDLGLPMADVEEGACYDGLQRDCVNLNQGAESTLAFLQATVELRAALAARCPTTRLYPSMSRLRTAPVEVVDAPTEVLSAAS